MSSIEKSIPSLLQGVSQQNPDQRQTGQVEKQTNMLSDLVTGIRRRPGSAKFASANAGSDEPEAAKILTWYGTLKNTRVHIWINTAKGDLWMFDNDNQEISTHKDKDVLKADNANSLRIAPVDEALYIGNTEKDIEAQDDTSEPTSGGFFKIEEGQFDAEYKVSVELGDKNDHTKRSSASYKTPSGESSGDVEKASPGYIANELKKKLEDDSQTVAKYISITALGNVVGISIDEDGEDPEAHIRKIESDQEGSTVSVSGALTFETVSELPGQIPDNLDGIQAIVGRAPAKEYYTWDSEEQVWQESGIEGYPEEYKAPILELTKDDAKEITLQGRKAGDEDTNPEPGFAKTGEFSGLSTYQGRLVILSGNKAALSAVNAPTRFFRSTVTELLDDDPIEVGSAAASAAKYEHALQFQRNLFLLSADYQAILQSSSGALTPQTAAVHLAGQYTADTSAPPVVTGRTFMFPFRRDKDHYGLREMTPSQYTDTYTSIDATQHIPRYLRGKPRFSSVDTGNSIAVFGESNDLNRLIVQEFFWDGDEQVQKAWHEFKYPYPIMSAYFADGVLHCLTYLQDGDDYRLYDVITDTQEFRTEDTAGRLPFLDFREDTEANSSGEVTIPKHLYNLIKTHGAEDDLEVVIKKGGLSGERIGIEERDGDTLTLDSSVRDGEEVTMGIRYSSELTPSELSIQDDNGNAITTNRATLNRFVVSTAETGQFMLEVKDNRIGESTTRTVGTVSWDNSELDTGQPRVASVAHTVIPLRIPLEKSSVKLFTSGPEELRITNIEYLIRYRPKHQRQ